jgi:hypothetical protein
MAEEIVDFESRVLRLSVRKFIRGPIGTPSPPSRPTATVIKLLPFAL